MSGYGLNRKETFIVPEGKRLVIRHWNTLVYAGTPTCEILLHVHGILMGYLLVTGQSVPHAEDVRWTAYEGETVSVSVRGRDASYAVDGYLFYDTDGRPDDADNEVVPISVGKPVPLLG
jgi:hypothetical protein